MHIVLLLRQTDAGLTSLTLSLHDNHCHLLVKRLVTVGDPLMEAKGLSGC